MEQALQVLQIPGLRGGQPDAISSILSGRDTVVLFPTGAGKSLCYIVPALAMGKLCVVVSPLLALIQDQAASLRAKGVSVRVVTSSIMSASEVTQALADVATDASVRLLFITPEGVKVASARGALASAHSHGRVGLVAIDEAHCVSSWGHDFRSSYRHLGGLRGILPGVPFLALTATATEAVLEDLASSLRLRNPAVHRMPFNRANIRFAVRFIKDDDAGRFDEIQGLVGDHGLCGLVYCLERRQCERVARAMSARGVRTEAYHAGIPGPRRAEIQARWSSGAVLLAATVAFGMGVDRGDVRYIVHWSMPKSLDGYYQEAGRAGRDGKASTALMFYSRSERDKLSYVIGKEEQAKRKRERKKKTKAGPPARAGEADGEGTSGKAMARFSEVVSLCERAVCRRRTLLAHFGDKFEEGQPAGLPCCDVCDNPEAARRALALFQAEPAPAKPWQRRAGGGGGGDGDDGLEVIDDDDDDGNGGGASSSRSDSDSSSSVPAPNLPKGLSTAQFIAALVKQEAEEEARARKLPAKPPTRDDLMARLAAAPAPRATPLKVNHQKPDDKLRASVVRKLASLIQEHAAAIAAPERASGWAEEAAKEREEGIARLAAERAKIDRTFPENKVYMRLAEADFTRHKEAIRDRDDEVGEIG